MKVTFIGKSGGGADFRRTESFKVVKDVGPEDRRNHPGEPEDSMTFKDW